MKKTDDTTETTAPSESVAHLKSQLTLEVLRRRKAEAELNSAQRELNRQGLIARQTRHAVVVTNPDGEIEWVNEGFTRLTGYQQSEALGRRPGDLLQGEGTDTATVESIRHALVNRESVDVEILNYHRDGTSYWAHLKIEPTWNDDGELLNFIGTQTNVTQLKQQAELLDGSETVYRALFESNRDALMSLDENGFYDCNDAALKLFGFDSHEEFCKSGPWDISPEYQPDGRLTSEAAQDFMSRAYRDGECRFEWLHIRGDGTLFDAEIQLSRYVIERGPVLQASVRDISARKAAEAEMIEAKKLAEDANKSKSEFLANMSHEIRTPLNGILGFTEVLQHGDHNKAQRDEYLDLVRNSGKHLLGLINNILDLSKVEAGKMEFECEACSPWEIVQEVASTLHLQATDRGLSLTAVAESRLPVSIQSDAVRLKQLLTNLVGNALKFTESGGITIAISCLDKPSETSSLVLEVRDTGIGISEESLQNIFAPFNQADNSITRRFGGTGLGLAICHRIAEGLEGRIEVESIEGSGSVFRVTVPVGNIDDLAMSDFADTRLVNEAGGQQGDESGRNEAGSSQLVSDSSSLLPPDTQILLCEDGATNRQLVELILTDAGATVTTAVNGRLGCEAVRDQPNRFDLVLMDMQMPVMDGYSATAQLREMGFDRSIFALTANAMRGDRQRCMEAGCTGYLTKPIDITQLLEAVNNALQQDDGSNKGPNEPNDGLIFSTLPTKLSGLRSIVERFIEQMPSRLEEIQDAFDQDDWSRLAELAHNLGATAGTVGFACFTAPALCLQHASTDLDEKSAQIHFDRIKLLSQRLAKPETAELG